VEGTDVVPVTGLPARMRFGLQDVKKKFSM
jgi:hypothetical protein